MPGGRQPTSGAERKIPQGQRSGRVKKVGAGELRHMPKQLRRRRWDEVPRWRKAVWSPWLFSAWVAPLVTLQQAELGRILSGEMRWSSSADSVELSSPSQRSSYRMHSTCTWISQAQKPWNTTILPNATVGLPSCKRCFTLRVHVLK